MAGFTPSLENLIDKFASLPSVGRKSAQRLAFRILDMSKDEVDSFIEAINNARSSIHRCRICCNFTDDETCGICSSKERDRSVICVVEDPRSASAIEELHEFKGVYHVLHGVISPMDGITPEHLKIKELLARIDGGVKEVIVATNPSVEGEATGLYIARLMKPFGVKVTRLAYGLPVGATLEYADSVTLSKAFEGRTEV